MNSARNEDNIEPEVAESLEAVAEARQRLAEAPAEMVISNHAMGLYELAAIHLTSSPPDLVESALAIDALPASSKVCRNVSVKTLKSSKMPWRISDLLLYRSRILCSPPRPSVADHHSLSKKQTSLFNFKSWHQPTLGIDDPPPSKI